MNLTVSQGRSVHQFKVLYLRIDSQEGCKVIQGVRKIDPWIV